jgi:PKD repeat protein
MNTSPRLTLNRLKNKSLFKLLLQVASVALLLTVCAVPAFAQMPLASAPTVPSPMSSAIPGDYGPAEAPASAMGTYSPTHSSTQPRLDVNLLGEPAYGPAPLAVDFLVIMPNPPSSLVYQWNFGDGSASSLPASTIIPHVYAHAGTYLCALVVTASNGLSTTVFTTIQVRPTDAKQGD